MYNPPKNKRTIQVVKLTAMGFRAYEISRMIYVSERGVEYHLEVAKKQLGAVNRSNLIYLAVKFGWIDFKDSENATTNISDKKCI